MYVFMYAVHGLQYTYVVNICSSYFFYCTIHTTPYTLLAAHYIY